MAKYAITITEMLIRTVVVEADDLDKAYNKAVRAYDDGEIVLDSEDYFDTMWEHDLIDEYNEDQYSLCEVIE